jgi:hypothetical protein
MKKLHIFFSIFFILCLSGFSACAEISVVNIDYPLEIFPVYCVLGSKILEEGDGMFLWEIKNNSKKEETVKITSEVIDYSNPATHMVTLKPGEVKTMAQFPVFNDKILDLPEQKLCSARFKILKDNDVIYEETKEITMLATDEMIWGIDTDYDMCFLLAAWVTPRDPVIGEIIKKAKEKMPDRTLCGYQRQSEEELQGEMDAVWQAVQELGISYVSSTVSFGTGYTQRVRLPGESIREKSANCADGTVLLASVYENLGLEPLLVITSDHLYLGVKTASDSQDAYYIETTMLGGSTFQEALEAGAENFQELGKLKEGTDYTIIDVVQLRGEGITPIPVKGNVPNI